MADFSDRMEKLAQDLTHLEINTIIKPCMTGRKMPRPRHALIEIADAYAARLSWLGYPVTVQGRGRGGYKVFDQIRRRAKAAIAALDREWEHRDLTDNELVDRVLLFRIQRMSDEIKGIFHGLRERGVDQWENDCSHEDIEDQRLDLPLVPDEAVMIRKIWEMGLEEIAMQTIIQIDGDVVTRVQPQFAEGERRMIHEIHERSVSTALDFWGSLIGIVRDFFGGLTRRGKAPAGR